MTSELNQFVKNYKDIIDDSDKEQIGQFTQNLNSASKILESGIELNMNKLRDILNDIEGASKENGQSVKGSSLYKDLNGLSEFMIRNSFILNFIYWLIPRGNHSTYIEFLSSAYNNQDILDIHLSDLDNILNYCKSNEITPYLIIIPFLNDLDLSHKLLTPIETHLIEREIRFINLVDILKDIPLTAFAVLSKPTLK